MDIRTSYRVQGHCPPDIRYSGPPALVFLHASQLKALGTRETHRSPAGETQAGPGCVCHPGQVLVLAAFVTVVNQSEPLVTGHCDGGSCLTLSSQRSAQGYSQSQAAVLLHGWITCCPLIISALLLGFFLLLSVLSFLSPSSSQRTSPQCSTKLPQPLSPRGLCPPTTALAQRRTR